MSKNPAKAIVPIPRTVDKNYLFFQIAVIIERRKNLAVARIRTETAMMFWEMGHLINTAILYDNRIECGIWIFPILPGKLAGNDYV